jgi:hypothetical protein
MKISANRGASWGAEQKISTGQSGYRIAVDIEGNNIYVTWMDYRSGSTWDLYYRRTTDLGASWGAETKLVSGTNALGAERPDIVARGNSVHLFWMDGRDNYPGCYTAPQCPEIYYKKSTDGGATWGSNIRLTNNSQWSARPIAATVGAAGIVVTYEQQIANDPSVSNEVYAISSSNDGASWGSPQRLTNAVGDTGHNYIAGDNTSAYVAYHDNRTGSNEIYFRQTDDIGATWQPEERITNLTGDSAVPAVVTTPNYVHVIWGDNNSGSYQVWYSRKAISQAPSYQCSDGLDNDGDGKIDYPSDPGCTSSTDNDETDPVQSGANYYISPSGSDSNPCTQAAPCASFNRAYQIASPGNTISVAAGTYSKQVIAYRASMQNLSPGCDPAGSWGTASTANCIRFIVPSAQVVIRNDMQIHGSSVWLDGNPTGTIANPNARTYPIRVVGDFSFEADTAAQKNDHITATGIKANGGAIADSLYVRYADSDMGDRTRTTSCTAYDSDGNTFDPGEFRISNRNGTTPQNILVERVYFHDVNRDAAGAVADCHDGGIQLWAVTGIVFRQNVWSQNWVYDIDIDQWADNVTFENNWFGCGVEAFSGPYGSNADKTCNGQHALQFNDGTNDNWLIRYNSFNAPAGACYRAPNCAYTNIRYVGNNGYAPACEFTSYSQNAWKNGTCSSTDIAWNGNYASTTVGSEDLHLSNGTNNAVDLVTLTTADYSLGTDIDGQTRTAPRDAGADEYNGAITPPSKPGDLNSDGVVNITDLSILLSNYGTASSTADINKDGTVNILDLSILLSNYGS